MSHDPYVPPPLGSPAPDIDLPPEEDSKAKRLKEMTSTKLWYEIWLDRLKILSFAAVMGAGASFAWKAWDAAQVFSNAYGQVQKNTKDIAELDAGVTIQLSEIKKQMESDKKELQDKIDKNKADSDEQMRKMYELQLQTLKEIKKL